MLRLEKLPEVNVQVAELRERGKTAVLEDKVEQLRAVFNRYLQNIKDVFNLNGSIDRKVLDRLYKLNCDVIFVVNKYDTLPKNSHDSVVKRVVKDTLA